MYYQQFPNQQNINTFSKPKCNINNFHTLTSTTSKHWRRQSSKTLFLNQWNINMFSYPSPWHIMLHHLFCLLAPMPPQDAQKVSKLPPMPSLEKHSLPRHSRACRYHLKKCMTIGMHKHPSHVAETQPTRPDPAECERLNKHLLYTYFNVLNHNVLFK